MNTDNIPMDKDLGEILEKISKSFDVDQDLLLLKSYMVNTRKHPALRVVCMGMIDEIMEGQMHPSYTTFELHVRSAETVVQIQN